MTLTSRYDFRKGTPWWTCRATTTTYGDFDFDFSAAHTNEANAAGRLNSCAGADR